MSCHGCVVSWPACSEPLVGARSRDRSLCVTVTALPVLRMVYVHSAKHFCARLHVGLLTVLSDSGDPFQPHQGHLEQGPGVTLQGHDVTHLSPFCLGWILGFAPCTDVSQSHGSHLGKLKLNLQPQSVNQILLCFASAAPQTSFLLSADSYFSIFKTLLFKNCGEGGF